MIEYTVLWRRIDTPGHDACGLWALDTGWRLAGTAAFVEEGQPCLLTYAVECDSSWRTLSATVTGWVGQEEVNLILKSLPNERWRFNGVEEPEAAGLVDIDLGFTPATNLSQFRRLRLEVGQAADAPAAYLHFPELRLGRLEQRYTRIGPNAYDYRAPLFGYSATLDVSDIGFVTKYPGLWELEAMR